MKVSGNGMAATGSDHGVRSPCISVCQLDPATRRCLGCLRSLEEIRDWPFMSSSEKRALLAKLARRKARG